jgi:nucleotide-binding universal stress UspA family protein
MYEADRICRIELGGIKPDPALAIRIPAELAKRLRLVPIAEDQGRVTIAMADPNDVGAQEVVQEIFGRRAYVVRCDGDSIDRLLGEIWPEEGQSGMRILACAPWEPASKAFRDYAEHIAEQLKGDLHWAEFAAEPGVRGLPGGGRSTPWDMILCPAPVIGGRHCRRTLRELYHCVLRRKSTLLLTPEPRWPIRRIMLLMQCGEVDLQALKWVWRLSTPGNTSVTILTFIPPVPAMYLGLRRMAVDIGDVLSTNSELGVHLRQAAAQLEQWRIEGHLRIRQGAPEWELRSELQEGPFDLIAVGGLARSPLGKFLLPDLAEMALSLSPHPVLITCDMPLAWRAEITGLSDNPSK